MEEILDVQHKVRSANSPAYWQFYFIRERKIVYLFLYWFNAYCLSTLFFGLLHKQDITVTGRLNTAETFISVIGSDL